MADLRCSVAGIFRIDEPDAIYHGRFSSRESVVLIYPYLRASVGQVWRMSGIQVPPMPTLDTLSLLSAIDSAPGETPPDVNQPAPRPRKRRRSKNVDEEAR